MSKKKVNLVDYIHPKMDILFLALNAPENSNNNAHWFTNNLSFWNLLFKAGLITEEITNKLEGDEKVFGDSKINFNNWIYGVTDLDKQTVETNSTMVRTTSEQVNRIKKILETNDVNKLCIMHSKVASAFLSEKLISNGYGFVGIYQKTKIYNVPFHNASIADKHKYYSLLINNDQKLLNKTTSESTNSNSKNNKLPKKEAKVTAVSGVRFTFPDSGNDITATDIKNNRIRITVNFKRYFPQNSQKVKLLFNNMEYECSYRVRPGKSNILTLGKNLVLKMNLTSNDSILFQKIANDNYKIEKR